ncbi:MAG: VOC family protein [Proteobacteria bacterium]|nr:VOC family protein [Pseudomonadota bacterium]
MAYHHLAVAARDMAAIDCFYSEVMGFDLVKVEIAPTPKGGWAKHFFYDTGQGELMAFWELHDETLPAEFPTSLSGAAGLPEWVNHIAFGAADVSELEKRKQRWLEHGYDVLEVDHNWCHSVYTLDPNGTMVEFCVTTAEFTGEDASRAREALTRDDLAQSAPPKNLEWFKTELAPAHERLERGA